MPYMVDKQLYSSIKTVLILLNRGLRPNFSRFSIAPLEAIHLVQVVRPFTPALVYQKTSSRPWEDGLLKLGRFIFRIILLFAPNYNLPLFTFACVINK